MQFETSRPFGDIALGIVVAVLEGRAPFGRVALGTLPWLPLGMNLLRAE
jgi:hypothetical protein